MKKTVMLLAVVVFLGSASIAMARGGMGCGMGPGMGGGMGQGMGCGMAPMMLHGLDQLNLSEPCLWRRRGLVCEHLQGFRRRVRPCPREVPGFTIIHTEGCIDNLGNDAPAGIEDPVRFKESGWINNDAFWWNAHAADWAYTASWAGPAAADHPIYTPVHRYARDIIVGLDHWVSGWVDWNIVLDKEGGPNHAGNFCGAPIMIDTATQQVYYTPIFHVLAQFSRTIRPGDKAVQTRRTLDGLDSDALHACATLNEGGLLSVQLLNTTKEAIAYKLQIADRYAANTIPANSVQTVRVQL